MCTTNQFNKCPPSSPNAPNMCHTKSMIDREMSTQQAEYEADQFTLCPPPLDFRSNPCHTNRMTYTRDQLISALAAEYDHLCHDSTDDDNMSPAEYLASLQSMSLDQLIDETTTDDVFTLDEFMHAYA